MARPTKYKPEYCEQLIEHMTNGFSFESFAGLISVDRQTIYNWIDAQPEFFDAKRQGFEKSRLFWEDVAIKGASGSMPVNATLTVFNLKNRFPKEWRDKHDVNHSSEDGSMTPKGNLANLSDEELETLKKLTSKTNDSE